MEVRGVVNNITVYDDFAHHPTAIATTVGGLRQKLGQMGRILAVLEPRSNTMKLGAMKDALPGSLSEADLVFGFGSEKVLGWSLGKALAPMGDIASAHEDIDVMVQAIKAKAQPGDHIIVMSNGGFGGVHAKLLEALK
jgi:UDP-N-acetylmuramate: L-alanyl-gamma-D-glutamyl-meso-diaminopimelate ligase